MKKVKWDISNMKSAGYTQPIVSIPNNEQETIIQVSKNSNVACVSSSDTTMITKLSKMPHFVVESAYFNSNNKIIDVKGTLPKNKITLRKK